jgi:hypothetical protein
MKTLEGVNLIDQFWLLMGNLTTTLTSFEHTLGPKTVGAVIASFFTLAVFLSGILSVFRSGGRLSAGVARGIIGAAWIFPLLYLPYQGTPYWIALFFGIFMWLGAWIMLRKVAYSRHVRVRTRLPR